MSVAEPFCLGHAAHHPLADIARDFGADGRPRQPRARSIPAARTVTTGSGETIAYDSLLIAVGARPEPVYRHAITFGADGAPEALSGLLADLEDGYTKRVAFVVPSTVAWSLPLYELAVMTARDVWSAGIDGVELVFVTPEARPLEAFGAEASTMVAELLDEEGIEFIGSTFADVGHGFVLAGDRRIDVGRTLALPVPDRPGDRRPARRPERLHPRRRARSRARASRTSTRPATPPPSRSSRAGSPPSRPSRRRRRSRRATAPTSTRSRSGRSCAGCS